MSYTPLYTELIRLRDSLLKEAKPLKDKLEVLGHKIQICNEMIIEEDLKTIKQHKNKLKT